MWPADIGRPQPTGRDHECVTVTAVTTTSPELLAEHGAPALQ
jgi:hypothetical protein